MKLHHRILGERPCVYIFHGLFGMSDNWQSFGRELAENGYRVVLTDLRNHGHSLHDSEFSYDVMADDLAELIHDAKSMEAPLAIGHSMGGKCVLKALGVYPDLFAKAVIVDIAPWEYPIHHQHIITALKSIDLSTIGSRNAAEAKLSEQLKDKSTCQFLLKNLHREADGTYSWRFNLRAIAGNIEKIGAATWPEHEVKTPLLFIRGSRSTYIDPARMDEIRRWFPHAGIEEIGEAGHWVHADQPVRLLASVLNFFRKHE